MEKVLKIGRLVLPMGSVSHAVSFDRSVGGLSTYLKYVSYQESFIAKEK